MGGERLMLAGTEVRPSLQEALRLVLKSGVPSGAEIPEATDAGAKEDPIQRHRGEGFEDACESQACKPRRKTDHHREVISVRGFM